MFRPDMRKMMKADTICQENEVSINVLSYMILNKINNNMYRIPIHIFGQCVYYILLNLIQSICMYINLPQIFNFNVYQILHPLSNFDTYQLLYTRKL